MTNISDFQRISGEHIARIEKEKSKDMSANSQAQLAAAKGDFEHAIIPALKTAMQGINPESSRCRLVKEPQVQGIDTVVFKITPRTNASQPRDASGTFKYSQGAIVWVSEVPIQHTESSSENYEQQFSVGDLSQNAALELVLKFVQDVFENA